MIPLFVHVFFKFQKIGPENKRIILSNEKQPIIILFSNHTLGAQPALQSKGPLNQMQSFSFASKDITFLIEEKPER